MSNIGSIYSERNARMLDQMADHVGMFNKHPEAECGYVCKICGKKVFCTPEMTNSKVKALKRHYKAKHRTEYILILLGG